MATAELTALLHRAQGGDASAAEALFDESYPLLKRLARARLRGHVRTPTLDTGSLVNEAYLRFVGAGRLHIEDAVHFRRWVAHVMRSVIVDIARRRRAERRGGQMVRMTLTSDLPVAGGRDEDQIIMVHEALDELAAVDARAAHVVELRYFAGMTEAEVATAICVTERTVRRDWEKARLMLGQMLGSAR